MRIFTSLFSIRPSRLTSHLSGRDAWPFPLAVYGPGENNVPKCARYSPESDFFISASGIPRIIVEVHSKNVDDRSRMLAQGATLVRLVNTITKSRTFVLPAVYFAADTANITEYLLYQTTETSNNAVCNNLP